MDGLKLPPRPVNRVELLSMGGPGAEDEQAALTRSYLRWCERRGSVGDCLSLLVEGPYLGLEARRTLALHLAMGAVWEGAVLAVEGMVSREALEVAVMSTLAGVLAVLLIPEPTMKVVAMAFTCYLVGYLGLDVVWGLLEGWGRLEQEAARAHTFVQLREVAERFGRMLGEKSSRVLVMLAAAAMGSTASLVMKGPGLPGFSRAAVTAEMQMGVNLTAVAEVRAVTVGIAQGSLTLSLAPGALAMASRGTGQSSSVPSPAPSGYRLQSIEPWRRPRFTSDGRLIPYKNTRNPPNPIINLGRNRAGQTISDGKTTIKFDKDGFPEFDSKFETLLDDIHMGSRDRLAHYKAANQKLASSIRQDPALGRLLGLGPEDIEKLATSIKAPDGYTWHHHQDVGRMQLILTRAHQLAAPHTGGMAIWGGGP
ncbi:HNH endonuclease [Archangium gephyra]|uniref:HNH endonuclease n=1 Tax=Archangium gephyra TaxID=48 RepID=UPI003B816E45